MPPSSASSSDTPYIIVIGGANVDIRANSQDALQQQDSNPGAVNLAAGGVARNIAENIARHGIDARLVSVVGNDPYGDWLLRTTADVGVDVQHVSRIEGAPTSTYVSIHDASGEMQVAINDMAIIDELTSEQLEASSDAIAGAALIVLDANLTVDAIGWVCERFSETPIFVDTVSAAKAKRFAAFLASIHSLKMNSLEAAALTELPADDEVQLKVLSNKLHEQGVQRVFVTRGADGAWYSADGKSATMLSPAPNNSRNVTGAGDAFTAALAVAWLQALSPEESVESALTASREQMERNSGE